MDGRFRQVRSVPEDDISGVYSITSSARAGR